MSERTESSSPDELVLLHSLERLRTREGLTPQRLVLHRDDVAAPLLGLAAVRRVAARRQVSVAEATLDVVRSAVREASLGRDRVVADAVLGLGAFEQQYLSAGVDAQVVWAIGSDSLGRRRQSLLAAWGRLHEGLGVGVLPAPSDRQLRGPVERQALLGLSRLLLRVDGDAVLAKAAPDRPIIGAASPGDRPRGRVVVVGGAVMDAVFSVTEIPQAQTSEEASGFRLSPGGKGLTQAVAAARLGLEVAFVGAVADDVYADQIVGILTDRGIDTSLLKRIPGERTPFTAVVENELGESLAANWRNESRVRFGVRDVDESVLEALAACDAVPHQL